MSPNPAYLEEQWKDYRRRKRLFIVSLISFPMALPLGIFIADNIQVDWLSYAPAFLFGFAFLASANYVFLFVCPFCDKHFASGIFWRSPIRKSCLHCGKAEGSDA